MKKLIFSLLLLLLISFQKVYSQSGWFWQNPLPQGNNLYSVHYFDLSLVYAFGDAGTFIKSTNGGLNWNINHFMGGMNGDIAKPLYASYFLNISTGFVAAGNNILRTSNGGSTWDSVTISSFPHFKAIFFINDYTGWSCCSYSSLNSVLKTTNGGLNWFVQNTSLYPIRSIFFINPNTGWFVGWYKVFVPPGVGIHIYKTTDGGTSYTTQLSYSFEQTLKTVFFLNENTGWAGGTKLWKTTNSGVSWNSQDIYANSISFVNSQTGYCVNYSGILKTTNAGVNWFSQSSSGGNSFSILDEDNILTVGNNGAITKTANGGNNWNWLSQCITLGMMRGLFFTNENTGFSIYHYYLPYYWIATVLKTTDKGFHWNFNFENNSYDLKDVFFIDEFTGWLCGGYGLIYKTTNTGINWGIQSSSTNVTLYKIYFINQNTGWILGDACILITGNGGSNWNKIDISEQFLNNMHDALLFLNSNTGLIAGGGGIGRTTNGGYNWQRTFDNPIWDLGKDNLNNFYAIDLEEFHKSTNIGLSWQLVSSPWKASVALKMVNSSTGFMSCLNGIFLKTTNGGVNWNIQKLYTNLQLRSLFAFDTNKIWVVGDAGVIFSTVGSGVIVDINAHNNVIPDHFSLSQNYPNPFNPVTRIKYEVPLSRGVSEGRGVLVRLIIYDILGREIETLVNENRKPGTYEVDWDGSKYASGVYFYRLITDEYVETKKMVLIK